MFHRRLKDAYDKDPNSGWFNLFLEKDLDAPIEIQNWPGIAGTTEEDWRIHREWYNSDKYKAKQKALAILKAQTYNKYFAKYGLTKTAQDYE